MNTALKFLIKITFCIFIFLLSSCTKYKININEEIEVEEMPIKLKEPFIEKTYYMPQEEKEAYDIEGFIIRARKKQLSENSDLRSMKFTAYLLEKLVCMKFMNNIYTNELEAKFDTKIPKKYDYYWTNRFGNLILQFGDKEQQIFVCGQIIFTSNYSLNKTEIKSDVQKMINILTPIADKIIKNESNNKLKTLNFTNSCKQFYKSNNNVIALNYQKKLPEFPSISKSIIKNYKNIRLKTSEYINNAMYRGCTGKYITDESYKKTINSFIENFIYCTSCEPYK